MNPTKTVREEWLHQMLSKDSSHADACHCLDRLTVAYAGKCRHVKPCQGVPEYCGYLSARRCTKERRDGNSYQGQPRCELHHIVMEKLVGNDTDQSRDQDNLECGHCQALQTPTEPMITYPRVSQEIYQDLGMTD